MNFGFKSTIIPWMWVPVTTAWRVFGLRMEDDLKDSFYEELEQVFDHFPRYHMKILLGDFNAKVGEREYFQTDNWE